MIMIRFTESLVTHLDPKYEHLFQNLAQRAVEFEMASAPGLYEFLKGHNCIGRIKIHLRENLDPPRECWCEIRGVQRKPVARIWVLGLVAPVIDYTQTIDCNFKGFIDPAGQKLIEQMLKKLQGDNP